MFTESVCQTGSEPFNSPDPVYENWIIARAIEIAEQRLFSTGASMKDPDIAMEFLRVKLLLERNEVFVALFLDNQHRIIAYEELFRGTINYCNIYPRTVVSKVLEHNCAAVIFAHNHPSGCIDPSQADRSLTVELTSVLNMINVRVIDHIIIGQGQPFSFALRGLL